jgi:hypothetical protein
MKLIYRQHAVMRMFERAIAAEDVLAALANGRVIEDYPHDTPYPSCLWLGFTGGKPLHIVFADKPDGERIIITLYYPNPTLWGADYATRRSS